MYFLLGNVAVPASEGLGVQPGRREEGELPLETRKMVAKERRIPQRT